MVKQNARVGARPAPPQTRSEVFLEGRLASNCRGSVYVYVYGRVFFSGPNFTEICLHSKNSHILINVIVC